MTSPQAEAVAEMLRDADLRRELWKAAGGKGSFYTSFLAIIESPALSAAILRLLAAQMREGEVSADRKELDKLVCFFNTPSGYSRFGFYGDEHGMSEADSAVKGLEDCLKAEAALAAAEQQRQRDVAQARREGILVEPYHRVGCRSLIGDGDDCDCGAEGTATMTPAADPTSPSSAPSELRRDESATSRQGYDMEKARRFVARCKADDAIWHSKEDCGNLMECFQAQAAALEYVMGRDRYNGGLRAAQKRIAALTGRK